MLTPQRLREILNYDPTTGLFIWKIALSNRSPIGSQASRVAISINGTRYPTHRLAWLYIHGVWPTRLIDHRNCDPSDNRIVNLREATHAENGQNRRGPNRNNASGIVGIYYERQTNKWVAEITTNRQKRRLGRFDTPEEASAAYWEAKRQLHPFSVAT